LPQPNGCAASSIEYQLLPARFDQCCGTEAIGFRDGVAGPNQGDAKIALAGVGATGESRTE
jgi:hypothetical protein